MTTRPIPQRLEDQIVDLYYQIAEMQKARQNAKRTGTVHEIGTGERLGQYRIKLRDGKNGEPVLTPWIRKTQESMGGNVKVLTRLTKGEQVDVVSESGDMGDARIAPSTHSDDNPLPSDDPEELYVMEVAGGAVRMAITKDRMTLKAPNQTVEIAGEHKMKAKSRTVETEEYSHQYGKIEYTGG